jgi:hypothetical protein
MAGAAKEFCIMGLFDWLLPHAHPAHDSDPDLEAGIERLIQAVDPRLKAISSAGTRLAPGVAATLAFCRQVVAGLPGPFDASPEHWRNAPQLRAMFTHAEDLQRLFSRTRAVQDFVAAHPEAESFHAILGAVLEEKKALGPVLDGDAIQHDVVITTLNFLRHQIHLPCGSAAELDTALVWSLFDQIGLEILARLSAMKESQETIQEEIALLRAQLAHVENRGLGQAFHGEENGTAPSPTGSPDSLHDRLAARLEAREAALAQARRRLLTLDDTLAWIVALLAHPETLVDVDGLDYRINALNQVVGPEIAGETVHFTHFGFTAPHPRQGVIVRVVFPCAALLSPAELALERERLCC